MQNPMPRQASDAVLVDTFFSKLFFPNTYLILLQSSNDLMQEPAKQSRNRQAGAHVYVGKFHCTGSGFWAGKQSLQEHRAFGEIQQYKRGVFSFPAWMGFISLS